MKQAFIFWPIGKEEKQPTTGNTDSTPAKTEETQPVATARGDKIIDISKWQGTIDFEVLKPEVAFVIARASCGSDKDVKIDEYATAMNKLGIPFGVYCYSYAGDDAKAKDEAQKIVKYASQYKPLFYVMDAEENKINNSAIKTFAKELRNQGATKIGCYCAHNHYKDYEFDSVRSLWDFIWIPRYGSNDGTQKGSTIPAYACDLWQYTSKGSIKGISGNVDMNVITGLGHDLNWFLGIEDEKTTNQKVQVVNGNVNVRTLPSTNGDIIGVAYNGDELEYRGETAENGWFAVKYNNQNGWISGKYGQLI